MPEKTNTRRSGPRFRPGYCPGERRDVERKELSELPQSDPLRLLLAQLLSTSREDMQKLRDKAHRLLVAKLAAARSLNTLQKIGDQFTRQLQTCQAVAHWMYNPEYDPKAVPFNEACQTVNRDPDVIRERMFDGLCPPLVKMVVGQKATECPVWETAVACMKTPEPKNPLDTLLKARWRKLKQRKVLCDKWQDQETFLNWAINNGAQPRMVLVRDNDKQPYSPKNCRFVASKEN